MSVALLFVSFEDNKQAKPTKMNMNRKKQTTALMNGLHENRKLAL